MNEHQHKQTSRHPSLELESLDYLWFQVAGTLCNLMCKHCFISASPTNDAFGLLSLEAVQEKLEESVQYGVKEYYFTGGEPFINEDMIPILRSAMCYGPSTVLTNAIPITQDMAFEMAEIEQESIYSLEFRVSLDGFNAEMNDAIRGKHTFRRTIEAIQRLVKAGFLPIITTVMTWPEHKHEEVMAGFLKTLKDVGYTRPRLKMLPMIKLGGEEQRTGGYTDTEEVTNDMMAGFDTTQLICSNSRVISDKGVHVCPILLNAEDSLLGGTLEEGIKPYKLKHKACYTCYMNGAICSNPSSGSEMLFTEKLESHHE
ncbi:MAG: radical SAM protein [Balneolales bacterium]